ncbi:hypothetical protein, partial [Streptococcus iniae]|uniref:hypothetical protein n=1 Tax=Streptococcus iniae TaxID=1346 RepID=UPI001C7CC866
MKDTLTDSLNASFHTSTLVKIIIIFKLLISIYKNYSLLQILKITHIILVLTSKNDSLTSIINT